MTEYICHHLLTAHTIISFYIYNSLGLLFQGVWIGAFVSHRVFFNTFFASSSRTSCVVLISIEIISWLSAIVRVQRIYKGGNNKTLGVSQSGHQYKYI